MEYNHYQDLHYGWTTPLDRLPWHILETEIDKAFNSDGVIFSSDWLVLKLTNRLVSEHKADKHEIACEIEITHPEQSLQDQFFTAHIRWFPVACDQCGQMHARRLRIGGAMKCTECVANNAKRASRKSSADHRKRNYQAKQQIACLQCSKLFTPERSTARFCGSSCRVAAHRSRISAKGF